MQLLFTDGRSSVVCLFGPSFCRRTPLLRVCCCGPGGREISIDSGGASRPPAAAPQRGAQQQMRAV